MNKITKLEDIEAWQDARIMAKTVYGITEPWKDFSLKDQMRRAAISVMSNIAEGYARGGNKEFVHFMFISKASASELQSHLYLPSDLSYISQDNFKTAYEQLDKVQRKLSAFIKVLRNNAINSITL
ncbi:MAG: four helix bundle protein [Thermodesulfovibrionales bacterium]|nr:four helix bundle protein [Thermodesulfovibrionales bacterium]